MAFGLRLLRTLCERGYSNALQSGLVLLPCRWYEESYRLLAEAERLLDDKLGKGSCPGVPSMSRRQPPEAFRHWDAASELPRCPLLPETPRDDALTLILRLRAEAAFRLGRCEEVRTIAAHLGLRYEHLENLLKTIDR